MGFETLIGDSNNYSTTAKIIFYDNLFRMLAMMMKNAWDLDEWVPNELVIESQKSEFDERMEKEFRVINLISIASLPHIPIGK